MLRNSIGFSLEGRGETASARVGSNLEYALMVEKGTGLFGPKGRRIVPKKAKVLRFSYGGAMVFATSTQGMKAQPFLSPALSAIATK